MNLQLKPQGWSYVSMLMFGALALVGMRVAEYLAGALPAIMAALPKQ